MQTLTTIHEDLNLFFLNQVFKNIFLAREFYIPIENSEALWEGYTVYD
jgi:hypothetical protein